MARVNKEKLILTKKVLAKAGFNIGNIKTLFKSGNTLIPDLLFDMTGRNYAVDIRSANRMNTVLSTLFYRSSTVLNAMISQYQMEGLAVFIVQTADEKDIQRLESKFLLYSPGLSWVVIRNENCFAYKLKGDGSTDLSFWNNSVPQESEKNNYKLSFSDLELWMFKVLFFHNQKDLGNKIMNAFQLSKEAGVSRRTANNWVNAMLSEELISKDRIKGLDLWVDFYLNLWIGKYRMEDNEIMYFEPISTSINRDIVLGELSRISQRESKYIITGHSATDLYKVKYSNAKQIHIYSNTSDLDEIVRDLNLIPSNSVTDIRIVISKYPESIWRGVKYSVEKTVVDPLQLCLDCYHLRERGYEQAAIIKEELIFNNE